MPWAIRVRCKHSGCGNRSDGKTGYCNEHNSRVIERKREITNIFKKSELERSPEARVHYSFYKSSEWREARERQLKREPLCRICKRLAQMVDHIVRIKDGGSKYNPNNLQSLCNQCHDIKRGQESHL